MSKLSRREFGKLASAAGAGAITASGLPPFSHRSAHGKGRRHRRRRGWGDSCLPHQKKGDAAPLGTHPLLQVLGRGP